MAFVELLLIGIGLSMDAFAVAVCKGLNMRKVNKVHCLIIALFFGGFQALMPLIGWALGMQFEQYITSVDHWIAFVLLAFLGGKMIVEALKEDEEEINKTESRPNIRELFVLAVATSIDALAVGVTFALLDVQIIPAVSFIGVVTFVCSALGVKLGSIFGTRYQSRAELCGGVILILIGLKILLGGLGIL